VPIFLSILYVVGVTMTTESCKNGAITVSRMNISVDTQDM